MATIIRNATYFDGTHTPSRQSDLAIADGVVTAVGPDLPAAESDEVIDAGGKWVMPGFVDIHTHYDAEVELDSRLGESVRHGVTTAVLGSCGLSFAVGTPEDLADQFCRVEAVPRTKVLPALEQIKDWETPTEYYDHLDGLSLGPNVAAMLGHSAIRAHVMGLGRSVDSDITPTATELARMTGLLEEALDAGFVGMSFNTLPWDKLDGERYGATPTPSVHAPFSEYRAFAKILRRRDSVMQFVPDLSGLLNIPAIFALSTGLRRKPLKTMVLTLMDSKAIPGIWRLVGGMANIVNRRFKGDLRMQALPVQFDLLVDGLSVPVMEEFAAGAEALSVADEQRRLLAADPSFRRKFRSQWSDTFARKAYHRDLGEPRVVACPDSTVVGKSFEEIGAERGTDGLDALLDLVAEHGDELRWRTTTANDNPANLAKIMNHPSAIVGFSDAGAHLRNMAFYDYPLHMLRMALDPANDLTIDRAVHRLTGEIGDYLNLDAGHLRVGDRADLVIVDPATLDDRLDNVEDDPNDELLGVHRVVRRHDECVPLVMINGRTAWVDGDFHPDFGKTTNYGDLLRVHPTEDTQR